MCQLALGPWTSLYLDQFLLLSEHGLRLVSVPRNEKILMGLQPFIPSYKYLNTYSLYLP